MILKALLARTTSNGLKSSDSEHMTDNGRTEVSNENDDEEKYSPTDSGGTNLVLFGSTPQQFRPIF